MNKYIPTIGLEIHAELSTASKMFCSCKNDPNEKKPNVNICPICLGHPGTLPVLNSEAIKCVLRVGTAVNGDMADFTEWDRKSYFYPDIPKGYQISQYKFPLITGGQLANIALERIHLEEDTAQSTHDTHEKSLVNFNRSGVPLMELVTKPVIHDAETAMNFAKELQLLLRTLKVSEANMEKGEMRVEANISVALAEHTSQNKFGVKTEVKNLNSFRSVGRAIAYEVERQIAIIESGKKVIQETRGWDDTIGETYSQRSKESSHDYRYFPEPDIPKIKLSEIVEFSSDKLLGSIPELANTKRDRYKNIFKMTDKEVAILIDSPTLSKYYESVIANFSSDPKRIKLTTNYLLTDYLGLLKKNKLSLEDETNLIPPTNFAKLISMIAGNEISSRGAKDILVIMTEDKNLSPQTIAKNNNLLQMSDSSSVVPIVEQILADNSKVVAEYKAGKISALQFLIGQAMKATKGSVNPETLKKVTIDKLS